MFRPQKLLELMTSVIVLSLGVVTLVFPQSLNNPSLEFFREGSIYWAGLFISIGVIRLLALYINGRWSPSSIFRFMGSMLGAGLFSSIIYNLLHATNFTYVTWGASTYIWILIFELVNAYFITKYMANYVKYRG
jgi:hypothetical protein